MWNLNVAQTEEKGLIFQKEEKRVLVVLASALFGVCLQHKKDSSGSMMADPKTDKCVRVAPPGVRPKRPGSSNPGRPKPQVVST